VNNNNRGSFKLSVKLRIGGGDTFENNHDLFKCNEGDVFIAIYNIYREGIMSSN